MTIKLYDWAGSPNGRKIRALAIELGIDLEVQNVDLMKGEQLQPEYLALNPNGKIPMLEENGWRLWESAAILCYLADKKPEKGLYPTDARKRAEVIKWLCWDQGHFAAEAVFRLARENFRPQFNEGEVRPEVVKDGQEAWTKFANVLSLSLEGNDWLVGNTFSIADLAIAGTLSAREWAKVDLSKYPRIAAYVERLEQRDSWKRTPPPSMG